MSRNWHVTGRTSLGGTSAGPATYGANTHADLIPFSAGPHLERSKVSQTLIDIGAALFAVLFVSLSAVSVGVAFAILFFCEL